MYLKSLEEEVIPWQKMWTTVQPKNLITNKKYNGINNLILSFIASERGYKDNRWCTFNQMKQKNWKFKNNANGQGVCVEYWSAYNYKEKKKYSLNEYLDALKTNPEIKDDFRFITKCTTVFNGDLIDGIPKDKIEDLENEIKTSDYISNIIKNIGVNYIEDGPNAYYTPLTDTVVIPLSSCFKNEYAYYSTQLHELAHSTGHSSRLKRNIENDFGTESYAKEELRAEISSSFLMQELGLEYDEKHLDNHKAYIQSWIKILKDKPTELFKAISDSQKIVEYLEENSKEQIIENTIMNKENEKDIER